MKLIQVPDVNDVIDLGVFKTAITEINAFNKSLTDFGVKILNDKFLFHSSNLKAFLSEDDYIRLDVDSLPSGTYLFDYVKKKLSWYDGWEKRWTMGDSTAKSTEASFSDCGEILIITRRWKTKTARFAHIPWVQQTEHFYIDFAEGSILSSDEYYARILTKNEEDANQ